MKRTYVLFLLSFICVGLLIATVYIFNGNPTGMATAPITNIQFNPIYPFTALGIIAVVCFVARSVLKKYNTED